MIAAIIPARGGSKRLPRKNILPFAGRPLIAWSITAAQACPSIDQIWVTTDDREIAAVAETWGAGVIDRPPALATDDAASEDVAQHALQEIEARYGPAEAGLLLQPTNPLRPAAMMIDAVNCFRSEPCDSLMTISHRRLKLGEVIDGCFHPAYPPKRQSRCTPPVSFENGMLYIADADLLRSGRLRGQRILAYPTERPFDDVDIDDQTDFMIGEHVAATVLTRLGH